MPAAEPMSQEIVERLKECVEKCRDRFREYEEGHRTRAERLGDTLERSLLDRKAERNRDMADMCEAALSTLTNLTPSGVERIRAEAFEEADQAIIAWLEREGSEMLVRAAQTEDEGADDGSIKSLFITAGTQRLGIAQMLKAGAHRQALVLPSEPPSQGDVEGRARDESAWLVETTFGADILYLSIGDPRAHWNDSRRRSGRFDEDWTATGYSALTGLLRFEKDAGKALRFARKEDAETFITAFGRLLIEPSATEHCWEDGRS